MNGMVSRPRHGLSPCAGGGGLDLGVMLAERCFHAHWLQRMRGALSMLPMASGPRIWRPVGGPEDPAQINLFEGMQP